jgi:hypothetical protein
MRLNAPWINAATATNTHTDAATNHQPVSISR